jgi:hypothetical protein
MTDIQTGQAYGTANGSNTLETHVQVAIKDPSKSDASQPETERQPNPDEAAMPSSLTQILNEFDEEVERQDVVPLSNKEPRLNSSSVRLKPVMIELAKRPATPLTKKLYKSPSKDWVEEIPKGDNSESWSKAALLVRYVESENPVTDLFLMHSITVQDPALKEMVRSILQDYPGLDTDVQNLTFETPFWPFAHRWDRLESMLKSPMDAERMTLLLELYNILEGQLGNDVRRSADLKAHGQIDWKLLWTLFTPGCAVMIGDDENAQFGLVKEVDYIRKECERFCRLEVAHIDFDGRRYGWDTLMILIKDFSGVKSITELKSTTKTPVLPQKYCAEVQSILPALEDRGRRTVEIWRAKNHAYKGKVTWQEYNPHGPDHKRFEFVDGHIIVDAVEHANHESSVDVTSYPHGLRSLVPSGELCLEGFGDDASDPLATHRWTTAALGVAPEVFFYTQVRGYCLTTKRWTNFEVGKISDIKWNDAAYERLVIPPPRKRLLRALIEEHRHMKTEADDMIQGKGQGLVFLLNGPPGTGKTLTAEAIAGKLHLPLYIVDASQLGEDVEELEDKLRQILTLAGTWEVVLLLDEADAFLERRDSNPEHAERNKRVAIFLRVLEYFRGILILTSNRAVEFDEAFHSRIHLTLHYADLDHAARVQVWKNLLGMAPHAVRDEEIAEFAQRKLNGRLIKNVIKMARLLAKSEDHAINAEDIREVVEIMEHDIMADS